ncbi:hypothetical protein KGA66_00675 [Actinocrinis puniceicyclus]|uniref:HEXXH motif domain-containing protein n=1 Tax=Actinocrinis puniceicyclus TaxID=977794 RepID=A0A8J8BC94_9ACTN|nr:HEXXH motif domain-containing protein [Actinocrinis puniceicyclus]MBS2961539.1 hypothetical protein [Actinocrinis puniceicyclus]
MIPQVYRVPAALVSALAQGRGDGEMIRLLASSQRSRQALLVRAVVAEASEAGHRHAAIAEAGYRLLARAERADRAAVTALLRYPAVGAWAIDALGALRGAAPQSARVGRITAVAAAAAVRARIDFEIDVPVDGQDRALELPSLGRLALPAPAPAPAPSFPPASSSVDETVAHVSCSAGTIDVSGLPGAARFAGPYDRDDTAAAWLAVRRLAARRGPHAICLPFDDVDPYRFPSHVDLAGHLDRREFSWWRRTFAEGWRILVARHPIAAREVAALVTAVSPIAAAPGVRRNASSRAAPGAVAATRPDGPLTMALALVHEVQHIKLGALMDLMPMADEASTHLYYAPWRPDPRPLQALLQGAYAHSGVAEFWLNESAALPEGAARLDAQEQFARWRDASGQVADFLAGHPGLTEYGRLFATGLSTRLRALGEVALPSAALELSHDAARTHRARWEYDNGRNSAAG